jgi:hypothetical protein
MWARILWRVQLLAKLRRPWKLADKWRIKRRLNRPLNGSEAARGIFAAAVAGNSAEDI